MLRSNMPPAEVIVKNPRLYPTVASSVLSEAK